MSDTWYYLRATVDISTQDAEMAKRMIREGGGEPLGRALFDSIQDGDTEIDAVENVEDHGNSGE